MPGERSPVEGAVGPKVLFTEGLGDLGQEGLAWSKKRPIDFVGVDDGCPQLGKHPRHDGLARGYRTYKTYHTRALAHGNRLFWCFG
jgi:hypothetical protein